MNYLQTIYISKIVDVQSSNFAQKKCKSRDRENYCNCAIFVSNYVLQYVQVVPFKIIYVIV